MELPLVASLCFVERFAGAERVGLVVGDEVFTAGTFLDHASEFAGSISDPEACLDACPSHCWACSVC
ncbi:MAG TPA: hypothetical protein VFC03_19350 [Acidimicrobiales bacterium]|nr:hypothetical protein [Acidimicrobiales bacterium]